MHTTEIMLSLMVLLQPHSNRFGLLLRRYGGMFVIGMAYRGTANNAAIQKLLHFAVSDVSDDVRRAAVLCLGFVLLGVPEQCPRIVSLLSQSYNPHVRYGAAMAVGICCSGTGVTLQSLNIYCTSSYYVQIYHAP